MLYKNQEGYNKYIKAQQAKRGYSKFLKLKYLKYRFKAKKAVIRLKISILKAKWLQEFKQEENIIILPKFKKKIY